MYILAGKKKLAEVRSTQLQELLNKAKLSGLPEDAQAAKDLDSLCSRFEKKIHDLELTRMISIQTAPQIRLVQNNDTLMVEKIQSTIVNTIPLWKSQMVLALGVEHSAQAAAAQREVTDMTNELLKKNAEKLKMATIETAKESERGIVDIETLKHTNETLISTFTEEPQEKVDETKPVGYRERTVSPYTGYKVVAYITVKDLDGNVLESREVYSTYRKRDQVYVVGPAEEVPDPDDPTTDPDDPTTDPDDPLNPDDPLAPSEDDEGTLWP